MINIGIVGIGFMGMTHYRAAQELKGARVTAICSRDQRKLAGDWRGIHGNFGAPGAMTDLAKVKKYDRLEALLDNPDIDLVDICNLQFAACWRSDLGENQAPPVWESTEHHILLAR